MWCDVVGVWLIVGDGRMDVGGWGIGKVLGVNVVGVDVSGCGDVGDVLCEWWIDVCVYFFCFCRF